MNYNYLRYFSVLAQVEHYTMAAARLGISQPSLSSAIHHLEDELGGVKLFEKAGRNVRLTEEGRYFHEKVDMALRELNKASMTLRDSGASAPVEIRLRDFRFKVDPFQSFRHLFPYNGLDRFGLAERNRDFC